MMSTKKYLKQIYHKNKILLIITVIISILQACSLVSFAITSKNILDGTKEKLLINSIYLVVNILLVIFLNALNQYLQQISIIKTEKVLKEDLYKNIFQKDYQTISLIHSGHLMNYLTSDVYIVANSIATIIPNLFLIITRLGLAFIVVVLYLPYLGIYFGILAIIVLSISFSLRKQLKTLHKKVQEIDGIARSYMQESIESNMVIKSFSGENKTYFKTKEYLKELSNAKTKKARFSCFINLSLHLVFQLSYVVTLVYAVWTKHNVTDVMTYGKILALVQLVGQIQGPLTNLSGLLPKYYTMQASSDRIVNIYNLKEEPALNSRKITYFDTININNLSFGYNEKLVLLNSFATINKNDFILIKGSSGIGKSTFLKLLLALYEIKEGSIIVEVDNQEYPISKATRTLFSYVPQGNFIFSGTIKENLTFFKENVTNEEIEKSLHLACAYEFVESLDKKLDTIVGEKGIGLSEGQIQRLAIARAIINNTPIILLDEATSALDYETEIRVLNNLKTLKDKTCIIVTHKDASKSICNKEFTFENGIITEKNL